MAADLRIAFLAGSLCGPDDECRPVQTREAARDAWYRAATDLGQRGGTAVSPASNDLESAALSWCCHHGGRAVLLAGYGADSAVSAHLQATYGDRLQVHYGALVPAPLAGANAIVTCSALGLTFHWEREFQARSIPVLDLIRDPAAFDTWLAGWGETHHG